MRLMRSIVAALFVAPLIVAYAANAASADPLPTIRIGWVAIIYLPQ